jgi:hypothetical protein
MALRADQTELVNTKYNVIWTATTIVPRSAWKPNPKTRQTRKLSGQSLSQIRNNNTAGGTSPDDHVVRTVSQPGWFFSPISLNAAASSLFKTPPSHWLVTQRGRRSTLICPDVWNLSQYFTKLLLLIPVYVRLVGRSTDLSWHSFYGHYNYRKRLWKTSQQTKKIR